MWTPHGNSYSIIGSLDTGLPALPIREQAIRHAFSPPAIMVYKISFLETYILSTFWSVL